MPAPAPGAIEGAPRPDDIDALAVRIRFHPDQSPMTATPPRAMPAAQAITLAFAPIHKRAFGVAVGLATGLVVFLVTVIWLLRGGQGLINLWILGNYFAGYTPTWGGAFLGFGWGFFTGFVAGWFLAFARNFVIATSLFLIRARSDLETTRDFLDHI
jgi:hypothetical protein